MLEPAADRTVGMLATFITFGEFSCLLFGVCFEFECVNKCGSGCVPVQWFSSFADSGEECPGPDLQCPQ